MYNPKHTLSESARARASERANERLTRTHQMIHDNIHRSKTTIASTFNICESHYTCIVCTICVVAFFDQASIQAAGSPTRLFFQLSQSIVSQMFHLFFFFISLFFVILSLSPFVAERVWVCVCLDKTRTPPSITNATATGAAAAAAVACYGCRCQCNADIINFTVKHDGFHVPHPTPGIGYVCVRVCMCFCVVVCMFFLCTLFCSSSLLFSFFLLSILPFVCHFCYNYCRLLWCVCRWHHFNRPIEK